MLRCIQRRETDPYYNLAAEESLLKTAVSDTFMTWRNEPSVIIGKHQNTSGEINHSFVESHHLPVIRRITGGGTVYHDLGNVNFSFIYTDRKESLVDFRYFTEPIILFLRELGLNASFEEKSSITVDGLKVSGNSAHIFKNKVLHHGTLLFNTDLDALNQAVKGREGHYQDKSVRSVHANVTNIAAFLDEKTSVEEFTGLFRSFILNYYPGSFNDELNNIEKKSIAKLIENKYLKNEWNYAYSPDYKFDDKWMDEYGEFKSALFVKEGVIRKIDITGSVGYDSFLKTIGDRLIGALHEKKSVSERLKKLTFATKSEEMLMNQVIQHLF